MKRVGNLFDKITSRENLELAHKNARNRKIHYKQVKMVDEKPLFYLLKLQKDLQCHRFHTSKYRIFKVNDRGKERDICDLPYYPDRVVHWAIMQVIEPIFMNLFIKDTYAAIPGRGIHSALRTLHEHMSRDKKGTQYCLKLDVKKFFPSIDKDILKQLLRRKIKCKDTLWLLDEIIDSFDKGIPIGNYTSQYFGNFYLAFFDHWMKEFDHPFTYINADGVKVTETRKLQHYFRYMDDMIILSDSKEFLHQLRAQIEEYLSTNLNLHLKGNWQVFPSRVRGVDFVGYRSFGDFTLLRNRTKRVIKKLSKRTLGKIRNGQVLSPNEVGSIASYYGAIIWGDTYRFYRTSMKGLNILPRFSKRKHVKGGKS